ncbi:MAG: glycosyltransferase family 39 protein [Phycisphaerales bacterium]|nr:glycosyltransferase family 39 protein [Phycisphaerales bacterium]
MRQATRFGGSVGLVFLLLYTLTASPGAEWQDPGLHQYRILTGELFHPFGLALSHPLHYWLGRAALQIPGVHPMHALNLLSAVFGAVGAGLLAGLLVRLTASPLAALCGTFAMGLAHAYWQMSAVTETYTIAAALLILEWLLLLRFARTQQAGWLAAVFLVNGLHVADHMLGVLSLATYGILLLERIARGRIAWHWLLTCGVTWAAGAAPYLWMILAEASRTGEVLLTLRSAVFGGTAEHPGWGDRVLNFGFTSGHVRIVALTFGYCFPSLAALLAVVGLVQWRQGWRKRYAAVLIPQSALIALFVARYNIVDLYTYFVPVAALLGLWSGIGAHVVLRWSRRHGCAPATAVALVISALLPPIVYAVFPRIAEQRGLLRAALRDIPYRDEYAHFFRPWRLGDMSASTFARATLAAAEPAGWIVGDTTTIFPVANTQHLGGAAPAVRIFWGLTELGRDGFPSVTVEAWQAHLAAGGRVIAIPSADVEQIVAAPLYIERSAPFWEIRLAGNSTERGE